MKGDNPLIHRIAVKDSQGRVIGEKEVVAYRGLLDMVHKERLSKIQTELVQAPAKDNGDTAIVRASVTTSRGTFTGIGDANPRNVNAKIAPHLIRMAETRAEARAMRKAVNIGVVAMEELGDDLNDDLTYEGEVQPVANNGHSAERPAAGTAGTSSTGTPPPSNGHGGSPGHRGTSDGSKPTDSQRRFLFRLLSERGIHGEHARAYIHNELGVDNLDDAAKADVSALIDHLKNGNGNGHDVAAEPGWRG